MSELVIAEKNDLVNIANEIRQLTGQTKGLNLQEMQTELKTIDNQPDWNQNDPNAKDYIKNRPGGYTIRQDGTSVFGSGTALQSGTSIAKGFKEGQEFVVEFSGMTTQTMKALRNEVEGFLYFCTLGKYPDAENDFFIGILTSENTTMLLANGEYVGKTYTITTHEIDDVPIAEKYMPNGHPKHVIVSVDGILSIDHDGTTNLNSDLIRSYVLQGYMVFLRFEYVVENDFVQLPATSVGQDFVVFSGYVWANADYEMIAVIVRDTSAKVYTNTLKQLTLDSISGIAFIDEKDSKMYRVYVSDGKLMIKPT